MEPAAAMGIIPHMKPALYRAAATGTVEDYHAALRQMRAEGSEDCQVAPNGNTVLHVAVLHGNKHFVEKILQDQRAHASASSMLYSLNNKKETVLHCAAEKGDADIVSVLINAIKVYDEELESGVTVKEMIRMTDDVMDMALHKAARMGHLGVVKLLIQEDNEFGYPTNDAGETPIYLVAESHFLYCLKEIIEKCQNLTYVGPLGRNALHAAILSPSGSAWEIMMQILLTLDAHLVLPGSAALSLWEKLMQIFRLHMGKAGCIQLLLEKEISLCEKSDSLGWTPLHYAVKFGDDEIVRKILEKKSSAGYIRAGIDDDDWTTIFHIATRHGNIKTMKCISNSLPDCWMMINCKSQNVLHEAILSRRRNMIKYILKYPQIDNLIDQKDNDGNTPLHLLVVFGWRSLSFNYMLTRLKRKHLVFNKRHQTPLDVASQGEVYSFVKHVYGGIPQRSGRRSGPRADLLQNQETSSEDTDDNDIDKTINRYLRISKTMTIVATLILTISFAAGFTVPGGYDSDKGYPILLRKTAFGYFVIADTAAFTSSVSAIFIYMIMVVLNSLGAIRETKIAMTLCALNIALTFCALTAVIAAFLSGMYTILAPFNSLAVGTTFLSSYLFLSVVFMYFKIKNYPFPIYSFLYLIYFLVSSIPTY
ncbi:protein ACCELERATED CELL DEATH 6-like [Ipomoea triloba]|uniref:protein ACCELERATED CELL DEATH 6-like n=1 Tax=Ipomoea triloba TaxID=35885 RepID=UPI00125D1462|nr:protein ACCELERATED CELL DEATH 6-like [Ipomoea triloba]